MLVESTRDNVIDLVMAHDRDPRDFSRFVLTQAVWSWWNAFKKWEEQDSFLVAFREKRLCITQRPTDANVKGAVLTSYDMEAKRGSGEHSPKIKYPGVKYAVGVDSLATRMDPANFSGVNELGIKNKYALGLFDLSASLLNPEYATIKGQLRWTIDSTKATWRVIFMALPHEEDVALYNVLKIHAHETKDLVLQELLKFIRHRMTRPKLAAAEDMGAGPYDIAPTGSPTKIKYGWKSDDGVLTEQTKKRAYTAAAEYQKIISNAKAITGRGDVKVVASNEITIALRQHAGKRFPIITAYDQERDRFAFTSANEYFPEGFIPDAWKQTRESRMV